MRTPKKLDNVVLIGLLLSAFSFIFGPWLGSQSGLKIMLDLGAFLTESRPAQDAARQQSIFALLLILALLLVAQVSIFVAQVYSKEPRRQVMLPIVSLVVLGIVTSLYIGYHAHTLGVILTGAGCILVILASLLTRFPHKQAAAASPTNADTDPMGTFQRNVAREFHQCKQSQRSFSLGIIGINGFDSYTEVFGNKAAKILTDSLVEE